MNWVAHRVLALCPLWVIACTVYQPSLLGEGDGAGTGSGTSSGSGSGSTGTGTTGAGTTGTTGGGVGVGGAGAGVGGAYASTGVGGSAGSVGGATGAGGTSSGGASGGVGGSGGTGVVPSPEISGDDPLDDFEDDNAMGIVTATNHRHPIWYLYNDMTVDGVQLPATIAMTEIPVEDADARPGSVYGLFTSVTGFTVWGAGFGVDFINPKAPYDISGYIGFKFFAKATSTYKIVRVNVSDKYTDKAGGVCVMCDNHFGKNVTLTDTWAEYTVLYTELAQEAGWGEARTEPALNEALGIQFLVKPSKDVDFWIDDVTMLAPQ